MRVLRLLAMSIVVLGTLLVPAAAQAAVDLTVADAGILDPTVASGARTKIVVPVKNLGGTTAPATTLTFFLSTDARLGRDRALAGSGKVPSLRARVSRNITTLVTLPRGLKPDDYRIFACVDPRAMVKESSDRNNCSKVPEPIAIERPATRVKVTPTVATGYIGGEGSIGPSGGAVMLINGQTVYQLFVPANALARPTRITMKPLASVAGMPFAAPMAAGVQLEPKGLEFARPAVLVITGNGIAPGDNQAVFSYDGNGSDLHLEPQLPARPAEAAAYDPNSTVYLPILHFSGAGLVPITDQEAAVQQRKGAANARDRLSQEARDKLKKGEDIEPLVEAYVDEVLMPEAAAASFSDAMYESAMRDYISWQRMRILLGLEDESNARLNAKLAQLEKLLDEAWKNVVKRAEARCQQGGFDVTARIIPLERQRQLLGIDGAPNEFSQVVRRCWHFELRVKSTVKRDVDGGVQGFSGSEHMTWTLEAKVPLQLKAQTDGIEVALGQLAGASGMPYTEHQYTGHGTVDFGPLGGGTCTYSFSGQTDAGMLDVQDGSIVKQWQGPLEPFFVFTLGTPRELIAQNCQGTSAGQPWTDNEPQWQQYWFQWWRAAHDTWSMGTDPGGQNDTGPYLLQMQPSRHPIVGTLTVNKAWPDQGATLTETWTLEHKPLPAPK